MRDDARKRSRLLRPLDPIDVLQDRLDVQTVRLTNAARLLNELASLSRTHPSGFAGDEYLRALEAASENFGVECAAYSELTLEVNITLGTEEE